MVYRFIGNEATIGEVGLKNIGDPITLAADVADDIILGGGSASGFAGGAALLPEQDFVGIFGASQVNRYAEDFTGKLSAAVQRLHAYRLELEG